MFPREEFPKTDAEAEKIVAGLLAPSRSPLLMMYVMLQIQHTWMPLAGWIEQALWHEPPVLSLSAEIGLLLAYAVWWLSWSLGFVWHVRGAPPYPVLRAAFHEGRWLPLYGGIIGCAVVVACLAHRF